jgi:hypothetical protein
MSQPLELKQKTELIKEVLGRTNRLSFHTMRIASNDSSIVACIFVAAVTFLRSRCLATIGGHR